MFRFIYHASRFPNDGLPVRVLEVLASHGMDAEHQAWSLLPPEDWYLMLVSVERVEAVVNDGW